MSSSKVHTQAKIRSIVPEDAGVYRIKVISPEDYAIGHIILNGKYNKQISITITNNYTIINYAGIG